MATRPSITNQLIQKFGTTDFLNNFCALKTKKSNSSILFLCPFHAEKNPSFAVYIESGWGKCFSCGHKADLVEIYQQQNCLSKTEAVKQLNTIIMEVK